MTIREKDEIWPALPLEAWEATRATLHMWAQIVGKIRLAFAPPVNHWWHVPLYVSARGLTTSPIPYKAQTFEIVFDFIAHALLIEKSDGATRTLRLEPKSVAAFYHEVMQALSSLGIAVTIWTTPVEVSNPVAFEQDHSNASYDPKYAHRFWRILVAVDQVLKEFRGRFIGKASPVHFFWGSFDLAATRFSGRRAPERPGADRITREAYSHEVSSVGWWPGDARLPTPSFYAYAAPEPAEFANATVQPRAAFYHRTLSEFLLSYNDVRNAASPSAALLDFCESTYEAAATLGNWDRTELERDGARR
jgi:hypothetical protein